MENVIFANGFEDYIEGLKVCPPKETSFGNSNPEFIQWRRYDRMILSWIFSTLTPKIMGQIMGFQTTHAAWTASEQIFSASSKYRITQLRLDIRQPKKDRFPQWNKR